MLAALRPGFCGQEPHLPLTRTGGPDKGDQNDSFISHFLLWESGSAEAQLEPVHWAQGLRASVPIPRSALRAHTHVHTCEQCCLPPSAPAPVPSSAHLCAHTAPSVLTEVALSLSGALALCPGPPAAPSFLTGRHGLLGTGRPAQQGPATPSS